MRIFVDEHITHGGNFLLFLWPYLQWYEYVFFSFFVEEAYVFFSL